MPTEQPPKLPLPKDWSATVKSAILHVFSLARMTFTAAAGCSRSRAESLEFEVAMLREDVRIKDVRFARANAHKRLQYDGVERLAILELRSIRGWSVAATAKRMLVSEGTISSWLKRRDDNEFVSLLEPVNKFPDFVRYLVQRFKTLCPHFGKVKIAEVLARAGLHLAPTTVGQILKEKPHPEPTSINVNSDSKSIHANEPNHVWHTDLTVVPITGFTVPWLPFSLHQVHPYCWWVAVVMDHFSRRIMGFAVSDKQPMSVQVRSLLGRAIHDAGTAPKHLVCDCGGQFDCDGFKDWAKRKAINLRFGAVGLHGSLAVVERLIKTLKYDGFFLLACIPSVREAFRQEATSLAFWYNEHRPHMTLNGKTPNEVYFNRDAANEQPRFEPRQKWPRGSPCAKPHAPVNGEPGVRLSLDVTYYEGRKHLPIVSLTKAA